MACTTLHSRCRARTLSPPQSPFRHKAAANLRLGALSPRALSTQETLLLPTSLRGSSLMPLWS